MKDNYIRPDWICPLSIAATGEVPHQAKPPQEKICAGKKCPLFIYNEGDFYSCCFEDMTWRLRDIRKALCDIKNILEEDRCR